MFGQVLDKIDTWVGRSFILASFFPFLIFLGANALVAQAMTPETMKYVVSSFSDYGPISGIAIWIAAAAAVAYLTDPLIGQVTKLLEGTYFPPPFSWWLSTEQTRSSRDLEEEEQYLGKLRSAVFKYGQQVSSELRHARDEGLAKHKNTEPEHIREAHRYIGRLQSKMKSQRLIHFEELEQGGKALLQALRANCADERQLMPVASARTVIERWILLDTHRLQKGQSRLLGRLHASWNRLVAYAHEKATAEHSRTIHRKQLHFGSIAPKNQPNWILMQASTEFGNHAAALRSFFEKRFRFDFEFFWPLVQLVAQGDQKITDALANAKQKLEFCVRIFLFTITFTAFWLVVGVMQADAPWIILVLGTGGFAFTALWLEMIHANYRSLSELIRNVVILKRFEVLERLHQDLPKDWIAEQKLWEDLTTQLVWGSDANINYQHGNK